MDNTAWMVVVGEVAALVHSVTIGTLAIAPRLSSTSTSHKFSLLSGGFGGPHVTSLPLRQEPI